MERPRRLTLTAVAVVSLGLLGACTSNPSAKAVAKDVVQSLPDLSAAERTCMLGVLDDMTNNEVEQLGEDNVGQAITGADSGNADMQAFIADLTDCREPS